MKKREMAMFIMVSCFYFLLVSILSCASTGVKDAVSIDDLTGIDNKLIWLKTNAESDSNYVFEVNGSERIVGGDSFFTPVVTAHAVWQK